MITKALQDLPCEFGHDLPRFTLTISKDGSTIRCKELQNSERSGIRARQQSRFFCARNLWHTDVSFLRREGVEYNTRKGNNARRLRSVLNLPTPSGTALQNVSAEVNLSNAGDDFLSHDTQTAPAAASPAVTPSSRLRLIVRIFGLIADTTEWPYEKWQALMARLIVGNTAVADMTMCDVMQAIEATEQQFQEAR